MQSPLCFCFFIRPTPICLEMIKQLNFCIFLKMDLKGFASELFINLCQKGIAVMKIPTVYSAFFNCHHLRPTHLHVKQALAYICKAPNGLFNFTFIPHYI